MLLKYNIKKCILVDVIMNLAKTQVILRALNFESASEKIFYDCHFKQVLRKASIIRNQKDTAHTKAERNILEAVKVISKDQALEFSYLD